MRAGILLTTTAAIWSSLLQAGRASFKCPFNCHCSEEQVENWKIACHWSTMADASAFSLLPMNKVSTLSVQCLSDRPGRYWSSMFASWSSLTHLTLTNCAHSGEERPFASGALEHLPSLRSLKLEGVSSSSLHLGDGEHFLTKSVLLDSLSLTSVGLEEVPSLCNLVNLKLLNVSSNRVAHLDWLSSCERGLVVLDVSNNRVTAVHRDHLAPLGDLRVLIAERNLLESVEKDTFDASTSVSELRLGSNRLSSVLSLPPKLVRLDLADNRLWRAPSTLATLHRLNYLNLSNNHLESFQFDAIKGCAADLGALDLSHNRLSLIDLTGVEQVNFDKLHTLLLANNRLERLQLRRRVRLRALVTLDLANNQLAHVGAEQLAHMGRLRTLRLEDNLIGHVDLDAFDGSPALSELSLARNLLVQVPEALSSLSNLTTLDLSGNRIAAIPKFLFDNAANLSSLDLSHNLIVTIDRYVFTNMPRLRTLNVANNRIEQVAVGSLDRLGNSLERLHLENNALVDLQGLLVNLVALQYLNISNNRIDHLHLGLLPCSLTVLQASHNRLTVVSNVLHSVRPKLALRAVDLSHNQLGQLGADLVPATVEALNLSHNPIDNVLGRPFEKASSLKVVDLRHCRLATVNESAFELAPEAASARLLLEGNPVQCDCRSEWLRGAKGGRRAHRLPTVVDEHRLRCDAGALTSVPLAMFLCAYRTLCAPNCPCCEFDSCDCKSVCPAHCQCEHDASHTLNKVSCSRLADVQPRSVPMHATEIRMDGATRRQLGRHAFLGRHRLERLYLNHSRLAVIGQKAFNGLPALTLLDLSNNELQALNGEQFYNVPSVTHLLLHNNRLATLGPYVFAQMPNLKVVTLHGNQLRLLPAPVALASHSLATLTLAQNPWRCDCAGQETLMLQNWLPANKPLVPDQASLYCQEDLSKLDNGSSSVLRLLPPTHGDHVVKVNFWTFVHELNGTFCNRNKATEEEEEALAPELQDGDELPDAGKLNFLLLTAAVSTVALLLFVVVPLTWKMTNNVRRKRLYNKYVGETNNGDLTSEDSGLHLPSPLLQYDLLICYNEKEQKSIEQEVLGRLEQSPPNYKVAMMYRDVLEDSLGQGRARQRVAEDLIGAMRRSQRVIIILTDSFIRHEWNETAMRVAFNYLMRDKRRKLLIVIMGPLPSEMDSILAHYLRTNHCLHWTDPLFWQKLYDCLPEQLLLCNGQTGAADADESSQYTDVYVLQSAIVVNFKARVDVS